MGAVNSLYHLYRLGRRLRWRSDMLEELRRRKLQGLLQYCFKYIPYYRCQFDAIKAQPRDFQRPEDLTAFPILEKETLRDQAEEILNPALDRSGWIKYCSSGSTGIPLELWYTPAERLRMGHTVTRELRFNGLLPHYRLVNITEPRHSSPKNKWYHRLGLMNEQFLSVYDQSHLNLAKLMEFQPQAIIGFPSVLILIGREMEKAGKFLRPKLLFTLAEVLTAQDRVLLQKQWGVDPIDLYGANEVGHIAFQCSQRRGYHINVDSLHVEILQGDRPAKMGNRGEVVVTNFDLRIMPILRYRVGDVAMRVEGSCPCGCTFPLLGEIAGRSDGFIVGCDGQLFSALEISLLLKPLSGVRQYRLIQDQPGSLSVEWVAKDDSVQAESQMHNLLSARLGEKMAITLRRVDEIGPEKSGKIRAVISSLPRPF